MGNGDSKHHWESGSKFMISASLHFGAARDLKVPHKVVYAVELPVVTITGSGAPSSAFAQKIRQAFLALPTPIRDFLAAQADGAIVLSQFITQARPDLKDEVPSGRSKNVRWDHMGGLTETRHHNVFVSEYKRTLNRWFSRVKTHNPEGILRHEVAHLLDTVASGFFPNSRSHGFRGAYFQDLKNFSWLAKTQFHLFDRHQNDHAFLETYAEVLASLLGGGCLNPHAIQEQFPAVTRWMKKNVLHSMGVQPIPLSPETGLDKVKRWLL